MIDKALEKEGIPIPNVEEKENANIEDEDDNSDYSDDDDVSP